MPRIFKPDTQSTAKVNSVNQGNRTFIDNLKESLYEFSNIKFVREGLRWIRLVPSLSIDNVSAYIINIKQKNHVLEIQPSIQASWKIDLQDATKSGWDSTDKIGYRLDGSTFNLPDAGLIWAFSDDKNIAIIGFGITEYPEITFSVVANGNRGSLATFTVVNAYKMKVGATVTVYNTSGYEQNYGVINTIDSNTSMTVMMYMDTVFLHNSNITNATGGKIVQVDNFIPWNGRTDTADEEDRSFRKNYRLIGTFDISRQVYIENPGIVTPVGSIIAWHKSLVSNQILPIGWEECDGGVCTDRESVYYGETLPDLNGDGRFLRGSATSGTMQAATSIYNRSQDTGNTFLLTPMNSTTVYNSDGVETQSLDYNFAPRTGFVTAATPNEYEKVRPVNMSVVWIIKTR